MFADRNVALLHTRARDFRPRLSASCPPHTFTAFLPRFNTFSVGRPPLSTYTIIACGTYLHPTYIPACLPVAAIIKFHGLTTSNVILAHILTHAVPKSCTFCTEHDSGLDLFFYFSFHVYHRTYSN